MRWRTKRKRTLSLAGIWSVKTGERRSELSLQRKAQGYVSTPRSSRRMTTHNQADLDDIFDYCETDAIHHITQQAHHCTSIRQRQKEAVSHPFPPTLSQNNLLTGHPQNVRRTPTPLNPCLRWLFTAEPAMKRTPITTNLPIILETNLTTLEPTPSLLSTSPTSALCIANSAL